MFTIPIHLFSTANSLLSICRLPQNPTNYVDRSTKTLRNNSLHMAMPKSQCTGGLDYLNCRNCPTLKWSLCILKLTSSRPLDSRRSLPPPPSLHSLLPLSILGWPLSFVQPRTLEVEHFLGVVNDVRNTGVSDATLLKNHTMDPEDPYRIARTIDFIEKVEPTPSTPIVCLCTLFICRLS